MSNWNKISFTPYLQGDSQHDSSISSQNFNIRNGWWTRQGSTMFVHGRLAVNSKPDLGDYFWQIWTPYNDSYSLSYSRPCGVWRYTCVDSIGNTVVSSGMAWTNGSRISFKLPGLTFGTSNTPVPIYEWFPGQFARTTDNFVSGEFIYDVAYEVGENV